MTVTRVLAVVALAGAAIGGVVGWSGDTGSTPSRQAEVAERGSAVMPFSLEATTHRFLKEPYGGRQVVVADDPGDRRQVVLIRQHLAEEARAFSRGEFDDPAAIHGSDMPGLETLRSAGRRLSVEVKPRGDGAQLTYRTRDRAVRDALHQWFDAQLGDHGGHAASS